MNGEVHQTGRYLGDRAIYTCGGGWEIVGPEERVCQADGLWSNNEPYCKKRGELKSDTYSERSVNKQLNSSSNCSMLTTGSASILTSLKILIRLGGIV